MLERSPDNRSPLATFPHLETIVEAAKRGSFTAAARALGLTEAAVSQHVQQLELFLDCKLFRRRGGRVTLAGTGVKLHDYARRILDLNAEARDAVTGRKVDETGELVVAASSVPGEHLLPPLLAAFNARHPKVGVRLLVTDSAQVLDQLERGVAHLGSWEPVRPSEIQLPSVRLQQLRGRGFASTPLGTTEARVSAGAPRRTHRAAGSGVGLPGMPGSGPVSGRALRRDPQENHGA